MIKFYTFLVRYRLVILNSVLLFGIICITFVPEGLWLHGTGIWQGILLVGIMVNIREMMKQANEKKIE